MSLEAKLSLRQIQKMVMTPMLQEAISLLQLSKLELVQTIRRELEENPVLEEVMDEGGEEQGTEERELGKEDSEEPAANFDWETYFEDTSDYYPRLPREEVERPDPERYLTKPLTLTDHLLFQLHLSTSDEELLRLGALIINNLDEDGYLKGGLEGSSLFRVDDLKDPASLAIKLRDAQDPLSRYLREQFDEETQRLLDGYDGSNPPSKSLQRELIRELNRLLRGNCLYEERRFAQVGLTGGTQRLIEQNPQGKDLLHLNRLLLEEAYPREIAKNSLEELGEEALERALRLVQSFDPPGVAARDLKECLLLQLDAMGEGVQLAKCIVADHLFDVEGGKLQWLAEKLRVPVQEVQAALNLIASLNPKPGRTLVVEASQYVVPDVSIVKVGDRFVVMLDEEGIPRLRVSPYYRTLLAKKAACPHDVREYVERRLRSALWLIKSIEQRQRTFYKVAESLVKFQRKFLESGISALCPLTLREVAQDIGMHESTVSRVTTNKYIQTPQGLFEMKYFFHRGVPRSDGQSVSSLKVKDLVRRYFASEDRGKPLSDEKIVEFLQKEHGIEIARRTVAKYRSQLKIPSSSRRRNRQLMGG